MKRNITLSLNAKSYSRHEIFYISNFLTFKFLIKNTKIKILTVKKIKIFYIYRKLYLNANVDSRFCEFQTHFFTHQFRFSISWIITAFCNCELGLSMLSVYELSKSICCHVITWNICGPRKVVQCWQQYESRPIPLSLTTWTKYFYEPTIANAYFRNSYFS